MWSMTGASTSYLRCSHFLSHTETDTDYDKNSAVQYINSKYSVNKIKIELVTVQLSKKNMYVVVNIIKEINEFNACNSCTTYNTVSSVLLVVFGLKHICKMNRSKEY